MSYLKGTDEGYSLYKKYLSVMLDSKSGVNAINPAGFIREGRCSREKYASNNTLYIFERIANAVSSHKDAEMMYYYYLFIEGNNNVRSYNLDDFETYKYFLKNFEEVIERELKDLIKTKGAVLFNGEPSTLTKEVYGGDIHYETYLYLSYFVDIPKSNDMVTTEVVKKAEAAERYFCYFTGITKEEHSKKAKCLIKNIMK